MMRKLWTFETKDKLAKFVEVLDTHAIQHETQAKTNREYTVLVDDHDYAAARKLLLKHRERRTSADLSK
jgi:hypothetical protein